MMHSECHIIFRRQSVNVFFQSDNLDPSGERKSECVFEISHLRRSQCVRIILPKIFEDVLVQIPLVAAGEAHCVASTIVNDRHVNVVVLVVVVQRDTVCLAITRNNKLCNSVCFWIDAILSADLL